MGLIPVYQERGSKNGRIKNARFQLIKIENGIKKISWQRPAYPSRPTGTAQAVPSASGGLLFQLGFSEVRHDLSLDGFFQGFGNLMNLQLRWKRANRQGHWGTGIEWPYFLKL
jgi:hypothetical protein